jgi:Fe-S cluster assembly protein SufD
MFGLYFGDGTQHFDFRTHQEHRAPRCRSEVLYKGAVADTARAVYSGLIYVAPGANKTDGFQTSRNLVLSKGAWAEAIPKLEILANDVRCSHAAAVGPIDEEQQYYLESRGLEPGVARRLIVFGFFEDVLRRVPDPALEAGLRLAVASKFLRAVEGAP